MGRRVVFGGLGLALLLALGSGCGPSQASPSPAPPSTMVNAGSWYSTEPWAHDGRPYETASFVVYSDGASDQARREAGDLAERLWAELLDEFAIQPAMFHYPAGQAKIDLYVYHGHYPQDWGGRAYYGGLFMWSLDHPQRPHDLSDYAPVMQHELVHVLQFMLMGGQDVQMDTWFREGMAEAAVGGTSGGAVTGQDQLDALIGEYGRANPIAVKVPGQIPSPDAGYHVYYPMFQLATEYLTSVHGLGRSPADLRDMLMEMAGGASFASAFEDHMGIGLAGYQDEFFSRMSGYLPPYRNVVFTPVGTGILLAVMVLLVVGALILGRRWRPVMAGPGVAGPRLPGRVGFYGALILASAILILFSLRGLIAVGTDDVLYNASSGPDQARDYVLLGGYFLASVTALAWAERRWIRGSRVVAFVGPALIIVVGVAVLVVVSSTL